MALAARGLIAVLTTLFVATGWAQPGLRPLPPLMRAISDEIGVMSDVEGKVLSQSLELIRERTGVRVVVVIAETIAPETPGNYVDRLSQRWAIARGVDPTRMVFVLIAVNDGLIGVIPGRALDLDAELSRAQFPLELSPLLRENHYFEALTKLAGRLREILEKRRAAGEGR